MAKFSLPAADDSEGPSGRAPKRQRVQPGPSVEVQIQERRQEGGEEDEEEDEESEEEEDDDDVEDGEEEDEAGDEDGNNLFYEDDPNLTTARVRALSPERTDLVRSRDGSIFATLTDPEVLDCPICFEPLTIPVFQCENGHVACSSCCCKIKNRCASCSTPIGYYRCRAIEKVLEAMKISCRYRKYGCRESFAYGMKLRHDKTCAYSPCACPLLDCSFLGSSIQLAQHFTFKHNNSAISFRFKRHKTITIGIDEKYIILQEEMDGSLFIIDRRTGILGNMITVSRIGPSTIGTVRYEVVAKSVESSLRLQSFAKCVSKRIQEPPASAFLLVPADFFGPCKQMKLEICIGL